MVEFFQDDNQRGSMSRLLSFLSFFPSTWVVMNTSQEHVETIFGLYVGAFVIGYLGGKTADVFNYRNRLKEKEQENDVRP